MSFLIAQILLLLALAAVFGGALVYGYLRGRFVDVGSENARVERLRIEIEALRRDRKAAEARIAALEADRIELHERLTGRAG